VRYNVNLEAQEGETYADILAVAQHAEALGFDGLYRADHYAAVWSPEDRGTTDAWATLAGLARETERITLGSMVTPVTFRPPANLAKVVATVAEMAGLVNSASRVHLGLGTGWLEKEHTRHGFPFEDVATRFRRLEEHATIIRGRRRRDLSPVAESAAAGDHRWQRSSQDRSAGRLFRGRAEYAMGDIRRRPGDEGVGGRRLRP
jgi:alkanesulfonate monooxygenase SsuD/methylene tetrahydromethanopterin reductase-like flavin-dependent oxidoreductase (luciferase family)